MSKSFVEQLRGINPKPGVDIELYADHGRSEGSVFWHAPSINTNWYPIIEINYEDKPIIHLEGGEEPSGWKEFFEKAAEDYELITSVIDHRKEDDKKEFIAYGKVFMGLNGVTNEQVSYMIKEVDEEKAMKKALHFAEGSGYIDPVNIRILSAEVYDTAKEHNLLEVITFLKDDFVAVKGVQSVDFDLSMLQEYEQGSLSSTIYVDVGYNPYLYNSNLDYYEGRNQLINDLNNLAFKHGFSRTVEGIEEKNGVLHISYTSTSVRYRLPESGEFICFSESEPHEYLFSTNKVADVVNEVGEFGGLVKSSAGEVLIDTAKGINSTCGSYTELLKQYIKDSKKKEHFNYEIKCQVDDEYHCNYDIKVNGVPSLSSYEKLNEKDFDMALKAYKHSLTENNNENANISAIKKHKGR